MAATIWMCVLTAALTCVNVQTGQQVDPSVIVQAQTNTVDMLVLEDSTSTLCLEGGC